MAKSSDELMRMALTGLDPCPCCGLVLRAAGQCRTCGQTAWVHDISGFGNSYRAWHCEVIRCEDARGGHVLIRTKATAA